MTTNNVDLEGLTAPRTVTLRGKQYQVQPIDGYGMHLAITKPDDKAESVRIMYVIAARCLKPHFTFDEVYGSEDTVGLSEAEVLEVMEVAQRSVNEVEATASPNSEPAGLTQKA